jgi:photosystem II stability/assembly factor-like uncharacterized protein
MLYIGTTEGIFSLKSGLEDSWELVSHVLKGWEVSAVSVSSAEPNRVVAGTRGDGVWVTDNSGETWHKPGYGKPGPGKVRSVTVDPSDPKRIYAGCEPIDVFLSTDMGVNWDRLESVWDMSVVPEVAYPVPGVEPHVRHVVIDPQDPANVYAALQVGSIAKTSNGGSTWELITGGVDRDVHAIVIDPSDTKKIFAATGGDDGRRGLARGKALYRTDDGGETWRPLALEFMQDYSVPLVMHPSNPEVLLAGLAKNTPGGWVRQGTGPQALIVRTQDGGATWDGLTNGLPPQGSGFAEALVFDQRNPERVYAGMRSGQIFSSGDLGDSWCKLALDVPEVTSMAWAEA